MKNDVEHELHELVKQHPHNYVKLLLSKGVKKGSKDFSHVKEHVLRCTAKLVSQYAFKYKWKTLVYWALNRIVDWNDARARCSMCGKPFHGIDVKNVNLGYCRKTCCKVCERKLAARSIASYMQSSYGVVNAFQLPTVKEKLKAQKVQMQAHRDAAKRCNGTFKASYQEDAAYAMLCKKFGKDNVIRQYHSKQYPFNCDFYVKPIDLYIECNFSWTHGGHWFDPSCESDQKKLQEWKDKHTKYYDNAIETWTVRDVKKRQIASINKVNYAVFWSFDDFNVSSLH